MLCDDCKKRTASIHMTKIMNQQKIEKHLCDQCAREYGELGMQGGDTFSVHDFITGILQSCLDFTARCPEGEDPCPTCGMKYSDFSEQGKIGCSFCYTVFAEQVEPLIKRIHGSAAHTGKLPKRGGGALETRLKVKQLRQELERRVEREEYEEAASLRDAIRDLESALSRDGAGGGDPVV